MPAYWCAWNYKNNTEFRNERRRLTSYVDNAFYTYNMSL